MKQAFFSNFKDSAVAFLFGYFFADLWLVLTVYYLNLDGGQYIGGFHFHHSLFGVAGLVIAGICYFVSPKYVRFWVFWSLGVIFQHTLDEAQFVFITRA